MDELRAIVSAGCSQGGLDTRPVDGRESNEHGSTAGRVSRNRGDDHRRVPPWLHVTVDVLGVPSPALNASGKDIGSDLGIQYGYLLIAIAVIAFFVLTSGNRTALIGVSIIAVLLAGYAALTAQSHKPLVAISANGQAVPSDLLKPHASLAYGVLLEAAAAIVLLVASLRMPNSRATENTTDKPTNPT